MSHPRKLIYSLLITIFVVLVLSLITNYPARLASQREAGRQLLITGNSPTILSGHLQNPPPPQSKIVDVIARVGGYAINYLSGWASPYAEVTLTSPGIARKTTADSNGFFIFNSVSLPDKPGELCLISQDINQLPSFPLCLAPPPRNRNVKIQGVLLSPTLSLEGGKIPHGKTAKASGMTFPNSKIQVYLFTERNFSFWAKITSFSFLRGPLAYARGPLVKFKLVKPAFAANFPIYEIKSNENGYFEFSLPTNYTSQNRIFIGSLFGGIEQSPKSNTLSFQVIGFWALLKQFLQDLFDQARACFTNYNDPLFIIVIEILVFVGLLGAIFVKKTSESRNQRVEASDHQIV